MKTSELTAKLSGAITRAKAKIDNKKINLSYSLDFESKLVSIIEVDLVFKEVVVSGHIGTGSKWKTKKWVEGDTPKRKIFTGKAREALIFLNNGAITAQPTG